MSTVTVAVIGAGPAGLAAYVYLTAEGFAVQIFERRPNVGGVWAFSEDPEITSTTTATKSQISKYLTCMSDFPYPPEYPTHIDAATQGAYYSLYAEKHGINKAIMHGVTIVSVTREKATEKWLVQVKGEESPRSFDKVILATGTELVAVMPKIEGLSDFEGTFIHGQAYKRGEDYKGKKVVVLGMGNSAVDAATEICPFASETYLSHRRGAKIIPRLNKDGPFDMVLTWKFTRVGIFLEHHAHLAYGKLVDSVFKKNVTEAWGKQDPKWRFEPSPSAAEGVTAICVSDNLIPLVREGKVSPVAAIKRIAGPKAVELDDGTVIDDVDTIIACTGYTSDFSIIPDIKMTTVHPRLPPLPNLYQMIFPPEYADSLACVNYGIVNENGATYRELCVMAIAQIWAGKSKLPDEAAMKAEVTRFQKWRAGAVTKSATGPPGAAQNYLWQKFLHGAAGTGLYEYTGWGSKGWKFWWRERELYKLVAWGAMTPHLLRLFETGKRPVWDGAREEIIRINKVRAEDFPKKK